MLTSRVRSVSRVQQDFAARNVRVRYVTAHRLASLRSSLYSSFLHLAGQAAKEEGVEISRLKIDSPEKMATVTPNQVVGVPISVLREEKHIRGDLLDLRGLSVFLENQKADAVKDHVTGETKDIVREMITILGQERTYLRQLIDRPGTTESDLFEALSGGVNKFRNLGFHATILRPNRRESVSLKECYWHEDYRAEQWGKKGVYSEPKLPKELLLSIINGSGSKFKVSYADDKTFHKQGLKPNPKKLKRDCDNSKGSPDWYIFKLASSSRGLEAVIYINNRVSLDSPLNPSSDLFPPNDATFLVEELTSYFETVGVVFGIVSERQVRKKTEQNLSQVMLSPVDQGAMLRKGEPMDVQGQKIRFFDGPSNHFQKNSRGVMSWLQDCILSVYKDTKIAEGKTRLELIEALSLEYELMLERVYHAKYLALIEGDHPNEHIVKGMVSGHILKEGSVFAFKIPEAMINKSARGRKLLVALTYEMGFRVFRKRWIDKGFFKGFFHMLFNGLPFYATTQSLRVVKDILRLSDLSVLRLAQGKALTAEQKRIIDFGSGGKADDRGIELGAYGGRIAIDEEEDGIVLQKPFFLLNLPIISFFCRPYFRKLEEEDRKIKRLFKEELGVKGRFHLVGNFTFGVILKVGLELFLTSIFRRKKKKPASN